MPATRTRHKRRVAKASPNSFHVAPLTDPPREIAPGETVACRLTLPPLARGRYHLEIDCVAAGVTWFAQRGSTTVALDVTMSL